MRIKVNIPEATSGDFRIEHVTTDSYCGSPEPMDTYTVLFNEHHNIMQDTTREYVEHEQFLKSVYGDILIAGLGLGMINQPLMDNPNVKSVTIIEKFQNVNNMVCKYWQKYKKFILIHDDINKWDINQYKNLWIKRVFENTINYTLDVPPRQQGSKWEECIFKNKWDNIIDSNDYVNGLKDLRDNEVSIQGYQVSKYQEDKIKTYSLEQWFKEEDEDGLWEED